MEVNAVLLNDRYAHRSACQALIDALVAEHCEITGALVCSVDGFEIAASLPQALSAAKLAAMTSSLVALGEAVSAEGGVEGCLNVVIEAQAGRLLLMDIPGSSRHLLTVICDNSSTLGHVLWAVRECSKELSLRMVP